MSIAGMRFWLLPCILSVLVGCSTVPPAPPQHADQSSATGSEHDGWLWKSLTGQKDAAPSGADAPPPSPPPVPPAPPANPPDAAGPLIPGPSSSSKWHKAAPAANGAEVIPTPQDSPAGPPPTIPPELPQPSSGVSIKDVKPDEPEKKKGFEWSDLAPENMYKNMKNAAGYGPDEKIARAAMKEGEALFRDKKYKDAAAKFATAADRAPDTPLEEDALFLQAESEFFSDQYPKAHDTYGGLLKKYAATRHLDTVCAREFALGRYWEQLYDAHPTWPVTPNVTDNSKPLFDTLGYAIQAYERIRQHDPTSPLADASLMALGNLYFRHGHYEEAAYNYDLLRKDYPNSKYQMKAHLLGLQASMRKYQGTAYDETPLRESGKIADQTLKQFGDKLGDERPRVEQAKLQIIEERANRDFTRAQYYDQHAYYGAARLYYQSVIDGYPGTEKAKEARKRMDQIRDLPDEPPNHFAWLTGLFDTKKR